MFSVVTFAAELGEIPGGLVVNSNSALFYKEITPLKRDRHRGVRLNVASDRFEFSRGSSVIPALVDEFMTASVHLPIVFMSGTDGFVPVFLVGLRTGLNALLDADGGWTGEYIPAYLRRYLFIIGEVKGGEPIICIDETSALLKDASGPALFDEEGKESPALTERIRFANDYYGAAQKNAAFVALLSELGLLHTVSIDAKFVAGDSVSLQGFMTVDAARLDQLSDEEFARLRKGGFLGPIYAHLASLSCVDRVRRLS